MGTWSWFGLGLACGVLLMTLGVQKALKLGGR